MFGGDGAGGPEEAAATAAHFCCTLVVAPPGAAPGGRSPGGSSVPKHGDVTACWGWPPPDATAAVAGVTTQRSQANTMSEQPHSETFVSRPRLDRYILQNLIAGLDARI